MSYTGAGAARQAREMLGQALAALQEDPNIPPDVMAVAQNIAGAVGALFEAERASSDVDGKASVKAALGSLSQTLALLQDVRGQHKGIQTATQVLAQTMSSLYPLTTVPSKAPSAPSPSQGGPPPAVVIPAAAPVPKTTGGVGAPAAAAAPAPAAAIPQTAAQPATKPRTATTPPLSGGKYPRIEANVGATTETNFYVGFSGEISEGGVFIATYNVLTKGSKIDLLVTLPGGFEVALIGTVRFVRDPLDLSQESEPGMGVQFEGMNGEQRELILRFIRKRPPIFYDD